MVLNLRIIVLVANRILYKINKHLCYNFNDLRLSFKLLRDLMCITHGRCP
jgi:hypothetical protein